jgi:hypothetical protein
MLGIRCPDRHALPRITLSIMRGPRRVLPPASGFVHRPKADPGTDAQRLRLLPHFCRWPPSAGSLGEEPTFGVAAGAKLSLAIPHGSTGRLKPRPGIRCAHSNSSITAFAALRSAVSNPSVKRPRIGASSCCASILRPWSRHSRARLVPARNSQDRAPCRRAQSSACRRSGPLADEIGELLARRFSSHEQEHRYEQEEGEGKEG